MANFSVYYDPEDLKELCSQTPFNLKKDLKGINEETIASISEEIANELYQGIERPPTAVALYWGKKRQAAYAKIKTLDVARDTGKSGGYRCIVLVDYVNHAAFLLHLYRHGHGEDENISQREKNQLKKLVDDYVVSLEANKEQ